MTTMLDYIKTVLQKVSFDKVLFEKELRKGLQVLVPEEAKQLRNWCYDQFSDRYQNILNHHFSRQQLAL
jgi:hypothetical protein